MLGIGKILIILLIVLLLFGNKLPQLGRNLGGAIRNFKRETKNIMDVLKDKKFR